MDPLNRETVEPWNPAKERAMLVSLRNGKSAAVVAQELGCTKQELERQQMRIAARLCGNGMPFTAAMSMAALPMNLGRGEGH